MTVNVADEGHREPGNLQGEARRRWHRKDVGEVR